MAKLLFFIILLINISGESQDQIEINADQFTYDKDNTRIYATGNVEILDEEFKLFAEKVFVNNSSKVLSLLFQISRSGFWCVDTIHTNSLFEHPDTKPQVNVNIYRVTVNYSYHSTFIFVHIPLPKLSL